MKIEFKDLKTIDAHAKEWYDRNTGNSYMSLRLILNYGMPDCETIAFPMQYGHGDQYQHLAANWLCTHYKIPIQPLWYFRDDNGIIIRTYKDTDCIKRQVKAWGTLIDD